LQPLATLPADGGPEAHLLGPAKGDGKLTFDNSPTSIIPAPSMKKISRRIC